MSSGFGADVAAHGSDVASNNLADRRRASIAEIDAALRAATNALPEINRARASDDGGQLVLTTVSTGTGTNTSPCAMAKRAPCMPPSDLLRMCSTPAAPPGTRHTNLGGRRLDARGCHTRRVFCAHTRAEVIADESGRRRARSPTHGSSSGPKAGQLQPVNWHGRTDP